MKLDIKQRLMLLARGDNLDLADIVCADAVARLEQLEAALRFMLVDPPSILNEPDTDAEVIIHYREVARAALDQKAST